MSVAQVTITPTPTPDPSKAPDNAVVTPNGGVQIDPNKPAGGEKPNEEKLILGKFKDQAALEAAYVELEKKQSTPAPKPDTPPPTATQASDAVKNAGLDMAALNREFAEKGELSADSMKALEAKGITKQMVDAYVNGLKSNAAQQRSALAEVAGGDKQLDAVYEWALANMSQAEIAAYNKVVDGGNVDAMKLALSGIVGRFTQATGKEPSLVGGETAPVSDGYPAFESREQVVEAMRDPRYANDPAYRAKVEKRLEKTELFSIRY